MSKSLIKWSVGLLMVMVAMTISVEIQDGAFPTGTDYRKEKEQQGGHDPSNYKKVYHRVIPGGAEHAEVVASNAPGSNSFSQTYSKHQSFGSSNTVQSQSYSSSDGQSAKDNVGDQEAQGRSRAVSTRRKRMQCNVTTK
uniref:Uncharacterized protein n=1 Tax=Caenorhabditis japonica TaxID=281687 RepID=A0A8R1EF97_CAEJA